MNCLDHRIFVGQLLFLTIANIGLDFSFRVLIRSKAFYLILNVNVVLSRSTSSASGTQLLLPAPASANGLSTTSKEIVPMIDLLSGNDFGLETSENAPLETSENALALVPAGEPQPASPSQNNALAVLDMFSQPSTTPSTYSVGQGHPSSPQFQQQQNFNSVQPSLYQNGSVPGMSYTQGSTPAWNKQMSQQQQPASPVYGDSYFILHAFHLSYSVKDLIKKTKTKYVGNMPVVYLGYLCFWVGYCILVD